MRSWRNDIIAQQKQLKVGDHITLLSRDSRIVFCGRAREGRAPSFIVFEAAQRANCRVRENANGNKKVSCFTCAARETGEGPHG